jgi:hypothetical protein
VTANYFSGVFMALVAKAMLLAGISLTLFKKVQAWRAIDPLYRFSALLGY